MSYPRSVYHKDYDPQKGDEHKDGHEAYLKKHCKLVKSEAEHKKLGPDWGDHPHLALKKEEVVEKAPEASEEHEHEGVEVVRKSKVRLK